MRVMLIYIYSLKGTCIQFFFKVGSMGITKICSFSGVKKAFVLCFTLKHVNNPTEIPSLMRKNEPGSTLNHTYEVCKSPVTLCL